MWQFETWSNFRTLLSPLTVLQSQNGRKRLCYMFLWRNQSCCDQDLYYSLLEMFMILCGCKYYFIVRNTYWYFRRNFTVWWEYIPLLILIHMFINGNCLFLLAMPIYCILILLLSYTVDLVFGHNFPWRFPDSHLILLVYDLWQTAKFLGSVLSYIQFLATGYVCASRHPDTVLGVPTYKYIHLFSHHTSWWICLIDFFDQKTFYAYISLHIHILLNLSWINSTTVDAMLVLIVPSIHIKLKFYLHIYLENLITINIVLMCKCSLILLLL
jgi:hypothetical protein